MPKPTYDSAKWKSQKERIIEDRGHLCQDCGLDSKSGFLHLHHTYYEPNRAYDDYPDDTLKLLCSECHWLTTQALMTLNFVFGGFTANQIYDISEAVQKSVFETGDTRSISNWICLCLSDIRNISLVQQ